jgi:hypothetical protein
MKSDRTDPSPLSQWKKVASELAGCTLPKFTTGNKFKKTALFILVPSAFD